MKRVLTVIALASAVAVPAFAADEQNMKDPACSDYVSMNQEDQVKSIETMISELPEGAVPAEAMSEDKTSMAEMGSGGTAGGVMATDTMMSNAKEACSAHPDATVSEALKMMNEG